MIAYAHIFDLWKLQTDFGNKWYCLLHTERVTVAARTKTGNVFAHSNAGIVGSNPTQGMDVCVYSLFVQVEALRWADPCPRSPTNCLRIKKMKWNKAFHGCHMSQSGRNRRERELYSECYRANRIIGSFIFFIPFFGSRWSMGHPWIFSVSLQFLYLGQSVGLLGRVASSSQDLYLQRTTRT
jgi:hypothetical protein